MTVSVDISPILQIVVGIAVTFLSIAGTAALHYLEKRLALQVSAGQQAALDGALSKALQYGAGAADAVIREKGWDHIETKNAVIGAAASYAVDHFPDMLHAAGLTSAADADAGLKTVLARAFPAAMAIAAASPATPPPAHS